MTNNNSFDKKPKIWFAFHDGISYLKDPNKLICGVRKKTGELVCTHFKDISRGDKVVYYAFENHLILGLFRVVSELKSGTNYRHQEISYYDLERITPLDKNGFLDVAKLSDNGKDKFEAFEHGIICANVEAKNGVLQIGDADYAKIEQYLNQKELLSKIEIDEKKVAVLSASLDFYGNRATSFASLFVASIFGIVTLSAIIQQLNATSTTDMIFICLSIIPSTGFAIAGWYTLQRYFFYGDIAERIRLWGLTFPYYKNLSEIKEIKYTANNGIENYEIDDLANCLLGIEKESNRVGEEQKVNVSRMITASIKQMLSKKSSFSVLYFFILILIYAIVYYCAFT